MATKTKKQNAAPDRHPMEEELVSLFLFQVERMAEAARQSPTFGVRELGLCARLLRDLAEQAGDAVLGDGQTFAETFDQAMLGDYDDPAFTGRIAVRWNK